MLYIGSQVNKHGFDLDAFCVIVYCGLGTRYVVWETGEILAFVLKL